MRNRLAVAVLLAAVACGQAASDPLQPAYQPQVTNVTDSFALQLTGVQNGSASLAYTWRNTGTAATVDRSCAISGGTVTLVIRDAAGTQVYAGPLAGQTGSVGTASGVTGDWTIRVDFADATGTINFRVQKG